MTNKALSRLNADEKQRLKSVVATLTTLTHNNTRVVADLLNASVSRGVGPTVFYLRQLIGRTPKELMACIKTKLEQEKKSREFQTLYSHAGCEVLNQKAPAYKVKYYGGIIKAVSGAANKICYCSPSNIKGTYDSKKYQIQGIPIFYLQGTEDANTPLPQAEYHFNNQATKERFLSRVAGSGHYVLNPEVAPPCLARTWQIVFSGHASSIEPSAVCPPLPGLGTLPPSTIK